MPRLAVALGLTALLALCAPAYARTAAENEAVASSEASLLLAQGPLPPGSVALASEPAAAGGQLTSEEEPWSPNLIDDGWWWDVPARTPAQIVAEVTARLHGVMRPAISVAGPAAAAPHQLVSFTLLKSIEGLFGMPGLSYDALQLADGSTALRVDAEAVWEVPRSPSEAIPASVALLRVTAHSPAVTERPLLVRSAGRVRKFAAFLNSLRLIQPLNFALPCPADFGVKVRLSFYAKGARTPVAVANDDPEACGGVALTLAGARQSPLQDTGVVPALERIAGVHLHLNKLRRRLAG